MAEILHQLIGSFFFRIIYEVLYIPGGAGFQPSTVALNTTYIILELNWPLFLKVNGQPVKLRPKLQSKQGAPFGF